MKLQLIVFYLACVLVQLPAATIPSFSFYKTDGTFYRRENIPKGKPTVFLFVDPTCDHCQLAVGSFNKQYKSFVNTNVCIVSLSEHRILHPFLAKYAAGLTEKKNVVTLQDKQNSFITLFGPRKYPGMFLYSSNNQLLDYEDDPQNIFRFVLELKKINAVSTPKK